ncbi:putative cell differentiation protein RCD1 -like protein [Capsicum annuum]|nr:putative cell differentiation protein RCD1 -like protein [Capsicum annuum]KAF3680969.1 putative cell differentiation protein RCD1 -like protein [Capsicum annuum]
MGEPSHDLLYPPEMTFKPQNPHCHAHQHDSSIVIEKIVKNEEQDEMARKVRSLEQSIRNIQGLGGPKSVLYKDLCMFPDVHLPLGLKMPKFDKYEDGEQTARVRPSIKESEMIDIIQQAQEPYYFHHLLSTIGNTFVEVIKIGEMVESGIKSEKIISQAALKATTQAIQSGPGSFGGNKRKEDVATIIPGPRKNWRGNMLLSNEELQRININGCKNSFSQMQEAMLSHRFDNQIMIYLLNLATRSRAKVLKFDYMERGYYTHGGLCYYSYKNAYKAVLFVSDRTPFVDEFVMDANLDDKQWRPVEFPYNIRSLSYDINITLHGRIHLWLKGKNNSKLINFDPISEKFHMFPIPEPKSNQEENVIVGLGVLNECPCDSLG